MPDHLFEKCRWDLTVIMVYYGVMVAVGADWIPNNPASSSVYKSCSFCACASPLLRVLLSAPATKAIMVSMDVLMNMSW